MFSDDVLSLNWGELQWSEWVPLKDRKLIPNLPGVYRVRAKGVNHLFYIGQTGASLRGRLAALSTHTYAAEMPFDDPHTAAPNLWVLLKEYGYEYECSAAPSSDDKRERMGCEDYLLWRHRTTTGVSTQCNYGRFHKAYSKSSPRSRGIRGLRLSAEMVNPASGPSIEALLLFSNPTDLDWMGLEWYSVVGAGIVPEKLSSLPCVYKMVDKESNEVVYIGQTSNCRSRFNNHSVLKKVKQDLEQYEVHVSLLDSNILLHQLHEIESDLLGAYYHLKKRVPKYQYGG
ncbi:MAG: hypothetical protein NT163_07395 [Chlorobiales bacterium]|nr:hypothetical protein [Chlorobiales bacterium]